MKLKPGDKVRFVNENLEGVVTSIRDEHMLGVTIDDDFEIPVALHEVIRIDFAAPDKNEAEQKNLKPRKSTDPVGVFIAFERVNETSLKLHLHNNYSDELLFVIYQKEQDVFHYHKQGRLERDEHAETGDFDLAKFDKWPALLFHFIFIDKLTVKPANPSTHLFKTHAKEFHQAFRYCFFLQKQAYLFRLDGGVSLPDMEKLLAKDFNEKAQTVINHDAKPEGVIDLHYDKLIEKGYPATIQNAFKAYIEHVTEKERAKRTETAEQAADQMEFMLRQKLLS